MSADMMERLRASTHAYVGRKPCGCAVAFVLDVPGEEKRTGKDVAEFIASGLVVERTPLGTTEVRACQCGPKAADLEAEGQGVLFG